MKDITFFGWFLFVVAVMGFVAFFWAIFASESRKHRECEAVGWDWVSTGRGHLCMKPGTVKK